MKITIDLPDYIELDKADRFIAIDHCYIRLLTWIGNENGQNIYACPIISHFYDKLHDIKHPVLHWNEAEGWHFKENERN